MQAFRHGDRGELADVDAGGSQPYVMEALEIFGADRCMFGSDWPVCLVAASYERVIDALRECVMDLTQSERDRVFGGSAIECYGLPALATTTEKENGDAF